ncbi:MAG: phage holin family protein [Trebonia sp.]
MLIRLFIQWVLLAAAIALTAWLLPGFNVAGGFWTYMWVAFLFSLVNVILGPILHLISLPLTIITFGLFALIVNTALVAITAWISSDLSIDGFFPAFFAAILISIFESILRILVPQPR